MWHGNGPLPSEYGHVAAPVFSPPPAWSEGEYGVVPLVLAPAVVAAIIAGGSTVAATGIGVAAQVARSEAAMRAQHKCIGRLDREIDHAIRKMWSTPIFTPERVAWEKKANDLKRKRARYLKSGCPDALDIARREKNAPARTVAPVLPVGPPSPGAAVPSWAWWGGGAALLALLGIAAVKRSREAA